MTVLNVLPRICCISFKIRFMNYFHFIPSGHCFPLTYILMVCLFPVVSLYQKCNFDGLALCSLLGYTYNFYLLILHFLNFALDYAIRRVQVNQDNLKLNGTYQLLAYAGGVITLGGSVHAIKKSI